MSRDYKTIYSFCAVCGRTTAWLIRIQSGLRIGKPSVEVHSCRTCGEKKEYAAIDD
jgi:hypothetical protein